MWEYRYCKTNKQINKEITYKLLLSTSLKFPITVEKANTRQLDLRQQDPDNLADLSWSYMEWILLTGRLTCFTNVGPSCLNVGLPCNLQSLRRVELPCYRANLVILLVRHIEMKNWPVREQMILVLLLRLFWNDIIGPFGIVKRVGLV